MTADISMLSEEQIGTYTRAFINNKADFIIVDGWSLRRSPWQREDLALLEPLGYLKHDPETSEQKSDDQYTAICYRPSPEFLEALRQKAVL